MVKTRFAGLLRGLLRRMDSPDPAPAVSSRPASAASLATDSKPAPAPAAPVIPPVSPDEIVLPLAPVIAGLPMELRAKIMTVPVAGATIALPVETVVSQLAFGTVKISFGELRRLAPGLFANSGGEHDGKMVNLPLAEILARMNPALLARRARQKVDVDETINGPFGAQGGVIAFTTQPLKSAAPAKPEPPVEKSAGPYPFELPPRANTPPPVAPNPPVAFAPLPGFEFPTKPANGNGHRVPVPPVPPAPPAPVALKFSAAPAPIPAAPVSAPATPPAPAAPRPEPAQPTILAALWDLAEAWPEELKREILAASLANENVTLAGAWVEAGLKRGRVTMSWKQLRTLAKPSSAPSPNDHLELDLPLKVIAPLFFAAQKKLTGSQKIAVVADDIPNLFFGFPQTAPAAPAAPAAPEPRKGEANYYVWGDNGETPKLDESVFAPPTVPQTDFMSRQAQPKEVVARAKVLPGVIGVVITLPDGLRVASEVPAELNADTLAAFIPQMFERMNQSAKELRMGALSDVSFTVGGVPWRIYRVNAVYFAAFGRPGESLPAAEIAALANELDRKKQP